MEAGAGARLHLHVHPWGERHHSPEALGSANTDGGRLAGTGGQPGKHPPVKKARSAQLPRSQWAASRSGPGSSPAAVPPGTR